MRFLYLLVIFLFSCSKQSSIPEEIILARVSTGVITIQDFIRRAEYTIRPDYCRQDNYIHKKIILNSLIAEKLTALEYEKYSKDEEDEDLDYYLRGRKEQSMRQVYFAEQFHSKVTVPDQEMQQAYKLAGRTVEVQFFNLPDTNIVNKIKQLDSQNVPLDSIYKVLWGGKTPVKEITWFDREQEEIHNAIFNQNINKGEMLGPIKTEDGTFVLMKIKGWKNKIQITESDNKQFWVDVYDKLVENKAKKAYIYWVQDLMSNKTMNLNPDVFYDYAEKAADYFFSLDSLKRNMLNQVLWEDQEFDIDIFELDDNDINSKDIILDYNGENWTVDKLNNQLKSHPFVFRKRKMKRSEFPEQLRLAIADLIRDIEITKQCYAEGYDQNWSVDLNTQMWHDIYNSKKYLADIKSKNKQIVGQNQWMDHMNPKIDSLQKIYSNQIEINMDAFEKINLTKTDMMVIQRGVPYPILVPSFPIVTSDNRLDYGTMSN